MPSLDGRAGLADALVDRCSLPVVCTGGSPPSPPAPPAEPARERPKLVLQPRSKDADAVAATVAGSGGRKSNPFGDAKPVDTQSKLLQIEEIEKKERVRIILCAHL